MCLSTCATWGQMILIHSCILILPRYSKLLGMLDRSAIKNSIPQLTWTKEMVGRLLSELKVVYRQILRDAPVSMKSPFSRQAHLGLYGLFILFLSQAPDCTICGMNQPCESDFFTAAEIWSPSCWDELSHWSTTQMLPVWIHHPRPNPFESMGFKAPLGWLAEDEPPHSTSNRSIIINHIYIYAIYI